ncbi:G2/mitotic-specific cyclin-1 [Capsicum chinense]|nr:G2/mitotic-specific cyclin-1 [Capsicum chinense]
MPSKTNRVEYFIDPNDWFKSDRRWRGDSNYHTMITNFLDDTQLSLLEKEFFGNLIKLAFNNLLSLNTDFWAFIECGLNTSKCAKNIYVKEKDVLPKCLVFDSCVVDSKEWFYSLAICGQPLNDTITKPPILVAPIRNETEDCIIIDAEGYKATGYSDVPIFVQHTEAMMEEIDRMDEEIEMEDIEDWSVVDIDSSDKKNELTVVEYIDDIYAYNKKAEDLILISDKAYARKEVLEMKLMGNALQFNMTVTTTYVFMRRFLKADNKVELVSFYLIELCLVEYEMLRFPPSMLAAATVFIAQCTLGVSREWNTTWEKHSSYDKNQILECSKLMVSFHQKVAVGKLTGVHRKYNTSKYGNASRCEPASFLLEAWF